MVDAYDDRVGGRGEGDGSDDLDLCLENESLELDVRIKGGLLYKSEEMESEPEVYNAFLRNILEYESLAEEYGDDRPLSFLFPDDFTFPPVDELDGCQLDEKLDGYGGEELVLTSEKYMP